MRDKKKIASEIVDVKKKIQDWWRKYGMLGSDELLEHLVKRRNELEVEYQA